MQEILCFIVSFIVVVIGVLEALLAVRCQLTAYRARLRLNADNKTKLIWTGA